jgi:hypothetical protein
MLRGVSREIYVVWGDFQGLSRFDMVKGAVISGVLGCISGF